jgi:hypothetical protein
MQPGWGDSGAFTPSRRHFVSSTSPLQGEVKKDRLTTPS